MEAIQKFFTDIKELVSNLLSFTAVQLANISFTDIIDILTMTVLLMMVHKFIRRRRTGRLIIGIVIWMALFALGRLFNLYTVSFLFGYIFQAGIIALVVIFQPELRMALERVGEEPLRGLKGLGESGAHAAHLWVRDVCEAVADMSRSRTGALIVFERSSKLSDVVQSGIEVDAKISPYLIRNIFFNKSPLHDGAVVVREGRVFAAGCLLPLTRRSDIDQDLGTRHRAAIGMTEVSDAFVLVVSEETGKISVAEQGTITRDITAQSLKVLLTEKFVTIKDKKEEIVAEVADTSTQADILEEAPQERAPVNAEQEATEEKEKNL